MPGGSVVAAVRELKVTGDPPAACCVPIAREGMSQVDASATASLFKALADPHRVRVVNLLAVSGQPVCVCDLTQTLGLSQPTVSFHMKKLVDSGLLEREQRGVWAYYSLNLGAARRIRHVLDFEKGDQDERSS
jgi:ArsR family transcriptional regulator, arsenate/arsenite/antimonite-responsive transcriptional repressor